MKLQIPKVYVHGRDTRTVEEVQLQHNTIRNICDLNEVLFKDLVDQESKKPVEKFKSKKLEMKLSGGRYLYYTDRTSYLQPSDKLNTNLPVIMTVHGIPGSALSDFQNLQQNLQANLSSRWINFSTPGLDNHDERRGTYNGYLEDTSLLMRDFLDELKVDKVVLVVHSAGGLYGKHFALTYPERIKAIVQIASIGIEMWGPLLFQNTLYESFGIDILKITREEIETERFRVNLAEKMKQFTEQLGNPKNKALALWNNLNMFHIIMLIKAQVYPGGFDQFFLKQKNMDKNIPRFFAYSNVDLLLEEKHIEQEIQYHILSPLAHNFKLKENSQFDKVFQLRDKDQVLKNFIFSYQDAGHACQHHKGFDLAVKLKIFISLIDQIQPHSQASKQNKLTIIRPNL